MISNHELFEHLMAETEQEGFAALGDEGGIEMTVLLAALVEKCRIGGDGINA